LDLGFAIFLRFKELEKDKMEDWILFLKKLEVMEDMEMRKSIREKIEELKVLIENRRLYLLSVSESQNWERNPNGDG